MFSFINLESGNNQDCVGDVSTLSTTVSHYTKHFLLFVHAHITLQETVSSRFVMNVPIFIIRETKPGVRLQVVILHLNSYLILLTTLKEPHNKR